jgi:hypothetical protein
MITLIIKKLPNIALHLTAARLRFGLNPKGHVWRRQGMRALDGQLVERRHGNRHTEIFTPRLY